MASSHSFILNDEAATVAFGEAMGRALREFPNGFVIYLQGDLGAGKTTLTRGVLGAFGHQGAVKSPTYTLVEEYELCGRRFYHFDLYRLHDPEELEYMGIRDYFQQDNCCLVEWSARGEGILPKADLEIELAPWAEARCVRIIGHSNHGQALVTQLAQHLMPLPEGVVPCDCAIQ